MPAHHCYYKKVLFVATVVIQLLWVTTSSHSSITPYMQVLANLQIATILPLDKMVVRLHVRDRSHLNAVAGELDIWEVHPEELYVIAAVTNEQYQWLLSLGYELELEGFHAPASASAAATVSPLDPRFYYFDNYYPNSNGLYIVDFLEQINDSYPELTELYDIGDAWMADQPGEHSRNIWVMRVSNEDPVFGSLEDKSPFFLFSGIHAREVVAPELALRYIKYLTEGYDGKGGYGLDPDVTWLVNHNVAYILVMQNPDGHWKNEEDIDNMRRKNMDWDDGCDLDTLWGVDLNRNHSFLWNCCGGSSSDPCADTYRGSSGASEPETQAFQAFFATVMEDQNGPNGDNEIPSAAPQDTTGIFISLHSYGDLVLWPWSFDDYGDSPNFTQLQTIGRKFAYYNGYDPSGSIWYNLDGSTTNWTYGKFGIPSYTFEVGPSVGLACGGFFPPYGCIEGNDGMVRNFWTENMDAFLYAHKIARTPYMTSYGPDSANLLVVPKRAYQGEMVQLTGLIADHRFGGDTINPVTDAEYFIDLPGNDGEGISMNPSDGNWGEISEEVMAIVNTSGLTLGSHYLLVHGKNDEGAWGPFTAVFFNIVLDKQFGLVVDFGDQGLWSYDEESWQRLAGLNVEHLCASNGKLVVDAGDEGLWKHNGTSCNNIRQDDSDNTGNTMVACENGLAVDFGSNGLWYYNGINWFQLTEEDVEHLCVYNGTLVADAGSKGLWEYNGSSWVNIRQGNPDNTGNTMVAFGSGLAVDFGSNGLWYYNGTNWSQLTEENVEHLCVYNGTLVADAGSKGLWEYNGSSWIKIRQDNPDNTGNTMAAYDQGLAVDFGSKGLWYYNGSDWFQLTEENVEYLYAYNGTLVADAGNKGLWKYEGSVWERLTWANPDNSGNTMVYADICGNCPMGSSVDQSDVDGDGVADILDNCPYTPNGINGGTCVKTVSGIFMGVNIACMSDEDCDDLEFCDTQQEDFNANAVGDVCECYADVNSDSVINLSDLVIFKNEFLRIDCDTNQCQADLSGDNTVNLDDLVIMKMQFLISSCQACI